MGTFTNVTYHRNSGMRSNAMFKVALSVSLFACCILFGLSAHSEQTTNDGQWPNFGGDYENTKYSPLILKPLPVLHSYHFLS